MRRSLWAGAALGLLAYLTGVAQAQAPSEPTASTETDETSYFLRDRNISVRGRQHEREEDFGWRSGALWLKPQVTLAAGYNDNISAVENDPEGSVVYQAHFRLDLVSDWRRHAIHASLDVPTVNYESAWTTTDIIAAFGGRYDVNSRLNFDAGVAYGDQHEPYSYLPSGVQLLEPISYEQTRAYVGFTHTLNRLRFVARADYSEYDYQDGTLGGGIPYEVDDRDLTQLTYTVRGDYALSELMSFFVAASANERDHRLDEPVVLNNEDSSGYDVLGGLNFDLTRLMRGEVAVGYFSQSFDRAGAAEVDGLAVRGSVEWYPDELLTVTIGAVRSVKEATVEEVASPGATTFVGTDISAAMDYEFRRNVLLGLSSSYSIETYDQVDRDDRRLGVYASAEYELNRFTTFTLNVGHETQESEGALQGRSYDANLATVAVRLRR